MTKKLSGTAMVQECSKLDKSLTFREGLNEQKWDFLRVFRTFEWMWRGHEVLQLRFWYTHRVLRTTCPKGIKIGGG